MRAVVQRVKQASVTVDDRVVGATGAGLLVYLGVGVNDDETAVTFMAEKVLGLRIFPDELGKMNRAVGDVGGGVLVVSQFTLFGDVRKGRRPAFDQAMEPSKARVLYESFVARLRAAGTVTAVGEFGAHMLVDATVDGPVTILVDSTRLF